MIVLNIGNKILLLVQMLYLNLRWWCLELWNLNLNLHMTSSLRLASLAASGLGDIWVFSARHVMFFPLSSGPAVSFTSDVVTFLSSEIWNKFKLMWLHQTPSGCQFPLTFIQIKWKIWKCKTILWNPTTAITRPEHPCHPSHNCAFYINFR